MPIKNGTPVGHWGYDSKSSGPNMYEQMGDHTQEHAGLAKEAQPHKFGNRNADGANNGG